MFYQVRADFHSPKFELLRFQTNAALYGIIVSKWQWHWHVLHFFFYFINNPSAIVWEGHILGLVVLKFNHLAQSNSIFSY